VAALENSVVQLEKTPGRGGRLDAVKAILWDLAQSSFSSSPRGSRIAQTRAHRRLHDPQREDSS